MVMYESGIWFEWEGRRSETLRLPALDYVTKVHAIDLRREEAVLGFAVLIHGRATGHRSVIAILSADLQLMHSELFARGWGDDIDGGMLFAEPLGGEDAKESALVVNSGGTIQLQLE